MIRENLTQLRQRIALACAKSGRQEAEVTLVAVSKGRSIAEVTEAVSCGISDIGENRVQEALVKYNDKGLAIGDRPIRWHMVGHLQTNKVKEAVQIFDLIHSVDSLRLAEEINKQAARINKIQDILLEVKASPEETKFGISPQEVPAILEKIGALTNIRVGGLMTIAPQVDNPEQARPYFRLLRELRDKLTANDLRLTTLSMGMTDDFEAAIEEGATMIRIGRGIFGPL